MDVAHLALELGARHQGGDAVDHQNLDGARAHQGVGDLEGLLAGVGLRDQKLLQIDAQLVRIGRIQGVLGVDEGAGTARLLGLGHHVERERRLARAFGPVDLDDAPARQPADAERDVERDRTGGDRIDVDSDLALAEAHDRALAERAFDLAEGGVERLVLVHDVLVHQAQCGLRHGVSPLFHTAGRHATRTVVHDLFSHRRKHVNPLFRRRKRDCVHNMFGTIRTAIARLRNRTATRRRARARAPATRLSPPSPP